MTSQNEFEKFRDRIAQLEAENSKLRELLRKSGIIYMEDLSQEYAAREQLNQGTLIRPTEVTADMANHFFSMFWGRTDTYHSGHGKNERECAFLCLLFRLTQTQAFPPSWSHGFHRFST